MFESPAWVTEMAHLVFATKSKDLSWTPGTRTVERENLLPLLLVAL